MFLASLGAWEAGGVTLIGGLVAVLVANRMRINDETYGD